MATLGKIRSQGTLLIIILGITMLIVIPTFFLDFSFFQGLFGPSTNPQKANVGSVNGEKVKYLDFYQKITEYTDFLKIERNDESLTDEITDQIRQETWNQIVMRQIIETDAKTIGMSVPYAEFKELTIGTNPSPIIAGRAIFRDENGQFDPNRVSMLISQLDNVDLLQQGRDELARYKNYWTFLEQAVKDTRLSEKYNTLLSKALVVNSLEAKYAYENNKTSVDLVYAMKPYFLLPDSTVSVSKSDVEALYKKRKEQFKQDALCDISYVVFDIKPSEADFQAIEEDINKAKEEFANTEDIVGTTNDLSDIPYHDVFLTKEDVANDLKEFAFSGEKGVVFGPFLGENDTYKMAKIVERTVAPDSVKLYVFPIADATRENINQKTDSVMKFLTGENFMELGGKEVGWLREIFNFQKEVKDAAFKASVNVPFVLEVNGFPQIFIVTEKTKPVPKVKLAVVEREVTTSKQTQAKISQEATKFASEATNTDKMIEKAREYGYILIPQTNVERNAPRLGNIRNSREIIRWAFDNKVNSVSDVKECGTQLVVAGIMRKNKEGYKTIEEVKPMLEAELRRDKKFELMKDDFQGKSIEQLQAENFTTDTVRGLTFGSMSAGSLGSDAPIRALAPIAEVNKISAPVKGNLGAYVFEVFEKRVSEIPFDAKQEIFRLNMQNQNMFYYMFEAMKKASNVKDERYRFF